MCELASGRQRTWTIPTGAIVRGLQLSPDGTRLVYLLERTAGGDLRLHLLPLAGTSSVTDGHDLLVAGDCPASMYHQRPDPGSTIISITKVVLTELPSP